MCVFRLENCNISGIECGKIEFLRSRVVFPPGLFFIIETSKQSRLETYFFGGSSSTSCHYLTTRSWHVHDSCHEHVANELQTCREPDGSPTYGCGFNPLRYFARYKGSGVWAAPAIPAVSGETGAVTLWLYSDMRGFLPLLHGRLLELLGASTQLAICSKSPCSIIAISSWPYLQDAISSSPPHQLSRKVVRTRSEHSSQSAHTLHYARTHPGTIAERNLISVKLARLCGDSRPHWVQTEKAEIPSCIMAHIDIKMRLITYPCPGKFVQHVKPV
jgi:hypothetical protein